MRKHITLECGHCRKTYSYQFILRCPECHGVINPVYNLDRFELQKSDKSLERYFSLTPIQDTSSIFSLGEGNTPCVFAKTLGREIGITKLYLKDETRNLTGSTKDRMAACVVSQFNELGIKEFVASSTGNSSTSFAYAVHHQHDMKVHLFCAKEFEHRHVFHTDEKIQLHVIDGDFVEAGRQAQRFAHEKHILFEGGFFNLARREGLKLAYLEALDQIPEEPTVIIQAVSSGMGLYGAFRGAQEYIKLGRLRHMPRFVAVQQDTCAPMVTAFQANSSVIRDNDIVHHPHGLAEAILRGDPSQAYPYIYSIITSTRGCFVSVSQDTIYRMRSLLKQIENIDGCYASATAVAASQELRDRGWITPEDVVLVNLTGGMQRPGMSQTENTSNTSSSGHFSG